MIRVHCDPLQPPLSWEEYKSTRPGNSIALDGFVSGPPQKDLTSPGGPWANFNHHEGVDRLATLSTCAQILRAMRQGLCKTFPAIGPCPLNIDCGDCDEDVALSVFLLQNAYMVRNVMNPGINRLVSMEDNLDATAGAYPYPCDLPMMGELAWIFDPYRQFRVSGEIDKKNAESYVNVIDEVGRRIRDHLLGNGKSIDLDTRYEKLGGGHGWIMIKEVGAQAKMGMFADGHTTYLSVRERPDGNYTYVIGKTAFAPIDLPPITTRLNALEGCPLSDQWGGGDLVMGSPRVKGSKLKPEEVGSVIDELIHVH